MRGKTVKVSLGANGTTSPKTFTLSVDGTLIGTKTGTLSTVSFNSTTTGYAKGLHTLSILIVRCAVVRRRLENGARPEVIRSGTLFTGGLLPMIVLDTIRQPGAI